MDDVACITGPDNMFNYLLKSVRNSQAEKCGKERSCYCSTHDPSNFFTTVQQIIRESEANKFNIFGDKSLYEDDEEYPIPMVPINDMNGYLCSFGLDRGGDKVEGFIN